MVTEHSDGSADGGNGNQGDLAGPFQCRVAEGVDIAKDEGDEQDDGKERNEGVCFFHESGNVLYVCRGLSPGSLVSSRQEVIRDRLFSLPGLCI